VLRLNRRTFVTSATLGFAFPQGACRASAALASFTPEAFGATGDGIRDDYDAFARLVRTVSGAGGGSIMLAPGKTYSLNRYVAPGNGVEDLVFAGCNGLTIEGNGATIRIKGDIHRDRESVRSLAGLIFRDSRQVVVRNVDLAGGVERTTRGAEIREPPSHGLVFQTCFDVIIDGVTSRHFAGDGLYIRESSSLNSLGQRQASRRFTVRNSRFLFNARQGLSVIQLRGALFENCDFSYTGAIDERGTIGPYGSHSPGAGVDIEPNRTPMDSTPVDVFTGDIILRGCRLIGNAGSSLVAAKYAGGVRFLDHVTVDSCMLECNDGVSGGQDGFIFDVAGGIVRNCTLQMRDKTAYLGWYPESDADFQFSNNAVYGRNSGRNRPLLAVRPTRGAPLIEGNRFVGQQHLPKDPKGPWLVYIDNLNATVRKNSVFIPAALLGSTPEIASLAVVFAKARLMDGNIYRTDFAGTKANFSILYAPGTGSRNESYRGVVPMRSIRPVRRDGG
jgi:hypothetical protein